MRAETTIGNAGHRAKRLILHLGHAKTGTTTLQAALVANRKRLESHGVVMPDTNDDAGNAIVLGHHLFGLAPFEVNRRGWLNISEKDAAALAARQWHDLCALTAETEASQVMISSEHFFQTFDAQMLDRAHRILHALTEQVLIVIYVRSPAAALLSNWQETVKTPHNQARRRPRDALKTIISAWEQRFPGAVRLHPFFPDALQGGDIVQDFFGRYLGPSGLDQVDDPPAPLNVSMSAEAMAILSDIRSGVIAARFNTPDVFSLVRREDGYVNDPTKPVMHEVAARSVRNWCMPDLLWLRDTQGIVFPDVAYEALDPDAFNPNHILPARVEDICAVNPTRKKNLWRRVQLKYSLPRPVRRWTAKW